MNKITKMNRVYDCAYTSDIGYKQSVKGPKYTKGMRWIIAHMIKGKDSPG